ncbi:hypothetical protein ACJX0J_021361, partial [Zea mays]
MLRERKERKKKVDLYNWFFFLAGKQIIVVYYYLSSSAKEIRVKSLLPEKKQISPNLTPTIHAIM